MAGQKAARIGLMVAREGNRRVLQDFLLKEGHECVLIKGADATLEADELTLLLVDEGQARRSTPLLRYLKAQSNLVPILLMLDSQSLSGHHWLSQGLVDDLIRVPIAKLDLTLRLEMALRLSFQSRLANLKLERLVRDASWGVAVIEPGSWRIQTANQAFATMHGYTAGEMVGLPLRTLQSQPGRPRQGVHESRHQRSDGSDFPIELEFTYYPEESGAGYYGVFARDIQTRKDIEAEIFRQHGELEEARRAAVQASQAKSDFLANISHEIRTPLNGMLATLDMLLTSSMTERQIELAELARHSSETLLSLVNEVLDFSKIEAGQMQLERVPVDLPALITQAAKPFALLADAKGLNLRCRWEGRLHPLVLGDPMRLSQILQNLLSNAVKFTHRGQIRLDAWSEESWTCLEVRDEGIGMSPEQQRTIFHAFTQADTSTTRKFGGTGLGLAICTRLVDLMGGRLELESQPGRGSRFRCWLPLVPATPLPETSPTPETPAQETAPLKILVCEDNLLNRRIMVLLLEQMGHHVNLAEDGLAGVSAWRDGDFDLILMDLQMPQLGGIEATREIREQGGTLPIVALTARAVEGDREACLAAGMDDYLSKPLRGDQLRELLARLELRTNQPRQRRSRIFRKRAN